MSYSFFLECPCVPVFVYKRPKTKRTTNKWINAQLPFKVHYVQFRFRTITSIFLTASLDLLLFCTPVLGDGGVMLWASDSLPHHLGAYILAFFYSIFNLFSSQNFRYVFLGIFIVSAFFHEFVLLRFFSYHHTVG